NAFNRVVYANPNTDPKLRFREGDEPEQSAARHSARSEDDLLGRLIHVLAASARLPASSPLVPPYRLPTHRSRICSMGYSS
ncbi:MAG TPA: hypothetical protein VKE51_15010, partial [Vicinamibacterales bacterium]|nr:hypothetical protein [Vicinamibacterales bacterium]